MGGRGFQGKDKDIDGSSSKQGEGQKKAVDRKERMEMPINIAFQTMDKEDNKENEGYNRGSNVWRTRRKGKGIENEGSSTFNEEGRSKSFRDL